MNLSAIVTAHDNAHSQGCDCLGLGPARRALPSWGDGRGWETEGRHRVLAFSPGQGTFPDSTCSDLPYNHARVLEDMNSPFAGWDQEGEASYPRPCCQQAKI